MAEFQLRTLLVDRVAAHPEPIRLASRVTLALAAAELLGDKLGWAPDRIIKPGILARVATGAIAGAAVAPPRDRHLGAFVGATVAVGAAYLTFAVRKRAICHNGQIATGLIEDAVALGTALWVARAARNAQPGFMR